MGRGDVLGGFERELAFLGHADEHHARVGLEAGPILSSHVVFALAALELNDRDWVAASEGADVLDEAIVPWAEGSRRSDAIAEMIAEKGAELSGRLEPGHIPVEIQAVNTRGGQRHLLAQYGGNAGDWRRRRLP